MTELTRRRDLNSTREAWRIYYGDVRVGSIGLRAGAPATATEQWEWSCGFNPPAHLGTLAGTAASFNHARAAFEKAWKTYLPKCKDADFDVWRRQQAIVRWKYAMWDAGCKLPTQMPDGRSRCFCGAEIEIRTVTDHIYTAHLVETE